MSAADSLAKVGGGVKNIAIGVAVAAGVGVVIYAAMKGKKIVDAAKDAGGYLFGADNASRTLGTDIFNLLNPNAGPKFDDAQARKTCAALYPPGSGRAPKPGSMCAQYLTEGAKLTEMLNDGYGGLD